MLYGKFIRVPHAHALILSMERKRAKSQQPKSTMKQKKYQFRLEIRKTNAELAEGQIQVTQRTARLEQFLRGSRPVQVLLIVEGLQQLLKT